MVNVTGVESHIVDFDRVALCCFYGAVIREVGCLDLKLFRRVSGQHDRCKED